MKNSEIIDGYINKHLRLAKLAYEREWFEEQQQYLAIVQVLEELKEEIE